MLVRVVEKGEGLVAGGGEDLGKREVGRGQSRGPGPLFPAFDCDPGHRVVLYAPQ